MPAGLAIPEREEAARLQASFPPGAHRPAWWRGHAAVDDAHVVVSLGSLSLNTQVLALLKAAEVARAGCLVVLAPLITDEALATLLVNDAAGVFARGILPLRLHVPEEAVEAVVLAIAEYLGVPAWDGRPAGVELARAARLEAWADHALFMREKRAPPLRRLGGWLGLRS